MFFLPQTFATPGIQVEYWEEEYHPFTRDGTDTLPWHFHFIFTFLVHWKLDISIIQYSQNDPKVIGAL